MKNVQPLSNHLDLTFMSPLIATRKRARKAVLAALSPDLAASNVGVAFLSAQITDLQERCAAMRLRINNKRSGRTASGTQAA